MSNFVWAISALIIIVIAIFLFTSQNRLENDTITPTPVPVSSPLIDLMTDESTTSSQNQSFPVLSKEEIDGKKIKLATEKGDIVVELYGDSPLAASNFINLVNQKFYDGLTFHRRDEGFVIQGGDPKGDGTGGPGYTFADEVVNNDYKRGIVAMANAGPNTNGSQFFIMLDDAPQLPKQYTIFGNVTEGLEVVDKIVIGDVIEKANVL